MVNFVKFNRDGHVYSNEDFAEIIMNAVRFFAGTPVQPLPPTDKFNGTGVYAIYYTGKYKLYEKFSQINRLSHSLPIYVGKAVPRGWRQSRVSETNGESYVELFTCLKEHFRSIDSVSGLVISDFSCRFMIFEDQSTDMISTVEAALIKLHTPLWNTVVDGFGDHTPGAGRFKQAKSDWDVIHPGRKWAERCTGAPSLQSKIEVSISHYFNGYHA
jgi:Eco29kI restriction endonuclease